MKKWWLGCSLLFLCSFVCADSYFNPQPVVQVVKSTATQITGTVSTSTLTGATQVDNPQLVGRVAIKITNDDTAANLWCTFISTTPTVGSGDVIPPKGFISFSFSDALAFPAAVPVVAKFWCLSDGSSATKYTTDQGR